MKYEILSINRINCNYYDVKFREVRRFLKPKEITQRVIYGPILCKNIHNGEYIHHLEEVIKAYMDDVDFVEFNRPPIVEILLGRI